MRAGGVGGALLAVIVAGGGAARAADVAAPELVDRSAFRVCADPNYLPFSNDRGEGFENRLAELYADHLGVPVVYTWFPRTVGFVRNTLRARACDVIMGVILGDELVQNTNPYYRSTFVMAVRTADAARYPDLDAPALDDARIGVVAGTPPADLLQRRGLIDETSSYQLMVDPRIDNQGPILMRDLAQGRLDVALGWGPLIGYWAKQQDVPITFVPLESDRRQNLVMDFRVSLGIRPGEAQWKHELEEATRALQPQIDAILAAYAVPLLDGRGRLKTPATVEPGDPRAEGRATVTEPAGYRTEGYRSPVPATLAGATVLDATALQRLIAEASPLLVDVMPMQPKPPNRPAGSVWIGQERQHIAGSVWLPNTGYGFLPAATVGYLKDSLATLTDNDRDAPIVFYCDPDCWMSWNAAKRAVTEFGYRNVFWFPAGAAGWQAAGHELEKAAVYHPEAAGIVAN